MASELTVGKIGVGIAPAHAATIYGTGAGNATVQIEGEGGADPTLNFLVNNATHWAIGADDSDSDSLKICQHSAVGSTNNFLTISSTGLTTFANGIAFSSQTDTSATGAAATSTTLDHYEEGTWTPTVIAASGSSPTYSAQVGHYTRVGNVCWVYANVTLTGLGSLSGKFGVSGLPWGGTSGAYPQGETLLANLSTSIVGSSCYINSTDSKIYFPIRTAAATSFTRDANASDFSATSVIRITLSYRIP